MFKLGMSSLRALPRGPLPRNAILAFDILSELQAGDERHAEIMYRINDSMAAGPRNWRRTMQNRFPDFDSWLVEAINARFPGRVRVHDMAVSSGVVALDLFKRLQHIPELDFVASDRLVSLEVVAPAAWYRVLFDDDGKWMQAIIGPLILEPRSRLRRKLPVNSFLAWAAGKALVPRIYGSEAPRRSLSLFHPEVQATASRDPRFRLQRTDILELPEATWDVARAMNVLFSWPKPLLFEAIRSIGRSVVDGGLVVIGFDGEEEGMAVSMFQRAADRLLWVADFRRPFVDKEFVHGLTL